ncbi:MAG: glycosyltransferase 61 family protein [Pseudomonadota bacterium]
MVTRPPEIGSVRDIPGKDAFFLPAGRVDAWFERRSDILIVTFFNLATLGEHEIPQPWFYGNVAKQGYSILGLITKRRDWYRNPDTPRLIEELREAGLFEGFSRVLFIGASMGGYAALTYARLVPGSGVLAFSPQSSLAPDLVPFEGRYARPQKKFDWAGDYRDAAEGIPDIADVTIAFDPFVPEDKAHAARLAAPHVSFLHVGHFGHQAIRVLKHVGVLSELFAQVAEQRFDRAGFYAAVRERRHQTRWLRELFREAEARGHNALAINAAKTQRARDGRMNRYLDRVVKRQTAIIAAREDHVITVGRPAPVAPYAGQIASLSGAFVVPALQKSAPTAFGVLHADQSWCRASQCWMDARLKSKAPVVAKTAEIIELEGTHLFGGYYRGHFGHFLVEALSRLWALDHVPLQPKSLIYVAHGSAERQKLEKYSDLYRVLGVTVPVVAHDQVARIEHLYVPELGFGWGGRFDGSPAFRAFVRGRLAASVESDGGDDLYISRSRLWGQMGQVIGEEVLEHNLARLGYEIFHPQEHPIDVQLAKYRAARRIVGLDGSAFHLVPFIMAEGGRVALIKRRSSANVGDYKTQFRAFCGVDVDVIDTLEKDWSFNPKGRVDFRAVGELDFAATFAALSAQGYIPASFAPDLPTEKELAAYREAAIQQRDGALPALNERAG